MKKNIIKITILVIIDQLIKIIVLNTVCKLGKSVVIIPNILKFSYVENTGAAFGMVVTRIFLIGVNLLIIIAVIKLMVSKKYAVDNKTKLGLSLIAAGGTGNLIDRVFRGYVVDYIDVTELFDYPVFNFADICIVIGVILIIVIIIINTLKSQESINERI